MLISLLEEKIKNKNFLCELCDIKSSGITLFYKHLNTKKHKTKFINSEKKKNFEDIDKIYEEMKNFYDNKIKNKKIEKKFIFQCSVCDFTSSNKVESFAHKKSHTFKCEKCNKIFYSKYGYDYHMISDIHNQKEVKYECVDCQRIFTKKQSYVMHLNSVTHKYKNSTCKICNKKFKYLSEFKYHVTYVHIY